MSLKKPLNYGKTFPELIVDKKYNQIYDVNKIDNLKSFSYSGMNYENRLIFAIKEVDFEKVNSLLEDGSSPRGYHKYPGFPLLTVIETINNDIKYRRNIDNLMLIIELLINYGARFDDYIVHIHWKKYDYMCENLNDLNKNFIFELYKKSPFNVNKYKLYLDVFIETYPLNDKKSLIKQFEKKYKKKNIYVINFFLSLKKKNK